MTKVSNDVMRPWIANRVTELLGFEDEVLINFIYGLLDGKVLQFSTSQLFTHLESSSNVIQVQTLVY